MQRNVDHIFKKLPPLVFQCSSGCQRLEDYTPEMMGLFNKILLEGPLLLTIFPAEDELEMRDYLLHPPNRLKIAKNK